MKFAIFRSRTRQSSLRFPLLLSRLTPCGSVSAPELTKPIFRIKDDWRYRAADLAAGFAIGVTVVLTHYLLVPPSTNLLAGAAIGMLSGMTAQMFLSLLLGGLLGSMEMMIPGMFVGMFGMLPSLLPVHGLRMEILLGGGLGLLVFFVFTLWDVKLKGTSPIAPIPPDRSFKPQEPSKEICSRSPSSNHSRGPSSGPRWDAAWLYDVLERGGVQRRTPWQRQLFQGLEGRVLFAAAGTGLNFSNFPPGKEIIAVDLSEHMLARARSKAAKYDGTLSLHMANLQRLEFADATFDTVATASTLCSVTEPLQALHELHRVLKPGGKLLLFEHVRSRSLLLGLELDFLNFTLGFLGSAMNRDTLKYVQQSGFLIDRVVCAYLDIFLAIEAHKPPVNS